MFFGERKHTFRRLFFAYILDWVLVVVFAVGFFAIDSVEPYHRRFSLEDRSIQYTFAERERVPNWLLVVIAGVVPCVFISVVALAFRRSLHDWHHGSLGLFLALTLTLAVTVTVKNTVGRPRPDFIDRCQPKANSKDAEVYGLSTSDICTQTDHYLIKDGFKSFPSGHSSTSFAGMTYISLYLAGKLKIFDKQGHTYKAFAVTIPFTIAGLVAISRTEDYRHHWQDVIAGGLLGMAFALFSYRQYYPSLESAHPDRPFSTRLHSRDRVPDAELGSAPVGDSMPNNGSSSSTSSSKSDLENLVHGNGTRGSFRIDENDSSK